MADAVTAALFANVEGAVDTDADRKLKSMVFWRKLIAVFGVDSIGCK